MDKNALPELVAGDSSSEVNESLSSDSLLELSENTDVLALTDAQLERLSRRPLNVDGFRLERVDVYNWGSFNNNVKSVYFGGQNVLMTGDNGAGKSSIIDAITVLLYDVKKVTFNQAAGAEKGERNLASYVLGLYKNDNSSGVKTELGLRSKDNAVLTVIMASFYNHKLDEHVVLVQCMVMVKPKTSPSRYYFIADRDFNLQQDILPVKDIRELGSKLKKIGAQRFDNFSEYYSHMQRLFGIENTKVLDLFYKTISMKSISNISDFVRKQMLEDFNGDELVEQMVERFNDLDASYKSVEEAKKQVEALEPICQKGEEYKNLQTQIDFVGKYENGTAPYLYQKKAEFLKSELEKNQERIAQLDQAIAHEKNELDIIENNILETRKELDQHGGHRLEQLNQNLERERKDRNRIHKSYENFTHFLVQLSLEPVTTQQAFNGLNSKLTKLSEQFTHDLDSYDSNSDQRAVERKTVSETRDAVEKELRSLLSRKSNIPLKSINVRDRIVQAIGCRESDLPFVGELIQVKSSQKQKWEYAIEKVLKNFALSMLVPEQFYKDVTEYVNSHDLGTRLVFFRIKENDFNGSSSAGSISSTFGSQFGNQLSALNMGSRSSSETLIHKIEIKESPIFQEYLRNQLERSYNFVCTEDLTEFRKERMALTPSGMSKIGGRNEKDDRASRTGNDYVLGWSNEDKIKLLQNEFQRLSNELTTINEAIKNLRQGRSTISNKLTIISSLRNIQSFAEIDYMTCDKHIADIQKEIDELQQTNNVVAALQQRLHQYLQDNKSAKERLDNYNSEMGRIKSINERSAAEYQNAFDLSEPAKYLEPTTITAIEHAIADAMRRRSYESLRIEYIDLIMSDILSKCKRDLALLKGKESSVAQELVNMQSRFNQTFVVAARNLDASRAAAWEDFRAFLDKLMTDDLPRFVDAFKDKLNRETIDQLGTLNAALLTHSRKIKERIADINVIMKGVDFNVDRYIQMEARESPDTEIKQFKIDLRNCTSTTGNEGTLADAEARFYQVKALIDRFKGEVNGPDIDRRWRNKVTDVKQWFDFAASEHSRVDDSQTDYYEDSGGKSGGQKEKLAYTVLASSIAYQYRSKARQKGGLMVNSALDQGMHLEDVNNSSTYNYADRSYRFVIIDEAFGRGSPQSVDYALTLFSKFNLQLLIATPMQKLDIIEKYVNHVAFVYRDEDTHESTVVNYELNDYIIKRKLKEQISRAPFMSATSKELAYEQGDAIGALSAQQASALYAKLDERILHEQGKFAGPAILPSKAIAPVAASEETKLKELPENAAASSSLFAGLDMAIDIQALEPSKAIASGDAHQEQSSQDQGLGLKADAKPVKEENTENRGDYLHLKDSNGNYIDAKIYAARLKEERRKMEQMRTEEALANLDFLDEFYKDRLQEEVHVLPDEEVEPISKQDESSSSEVKQPKSHKAEEQEPHYAHSLEDLLIIEED